MKCAEPEILIWVSLKKTKIFCVGKEAAHGNSACMGEYMRAHGAKSTKFGRTEGWERTADVVIAEKNGFLSCPYNIDTMF